MSDTSLTFQVVNGRISGKIDRDDAMVQAIDKILQTVRFVHPIYSSQYGHDLDTLYGRPFDYAEVEAKRMVTEALLSDTRVTEVVIDGIEKVGLDTLVLKGWCTTVYGNLSVQSEVKVIES